MEHEIIPVNVNSVDPSDVVKFTQDMRYRMFDELTTSGTKLTDNIKDAMQLLRDMDQSALTTRKLNIEEQVADDNSQILVHHRQLREMLGNRDPFELRDNSPLPVAERVRPALPETIPHREVTFVKGEDAQGEQVLSVGNYVSVEE